MKGKSKAVGFFRGLTVTMASLMTLGVGLSVGAFLNETDINENLGTKSREFVNDTENAKYKSDYTSWKEMTSAKSDNIKATAEEGIVLLKNDGVLPLKADKVNVFGRNSESPAYGGGGGAGQVTDPNVVSVKDGFKKAGISINETLYNFYSTCDKRKVGGMRSSEYATGEVNPSAFSDEVKNSLQNYGDTAIIWLTRCIGEGTDPSYGFMELDDNEKALISYVESLDYVKNIVVVLNEDNTMGIGALKNDERINAIVHAGGLGLNGTEALGEILKGKVNPSGHLTDTYAAYSMSSPAAQNMYDHELTNAEEVELYVGKGDQEKGKKEYATHYIAEKEGIYIGYRYYETRYEDSVLNASGSKATASNGTFMGEDAWDYEKEVAYPFGYGLSYTTFTQTLNSVNIDSNGEITASVTVKNDGSVAGKSVVQLYAQSPYTDYDKTNLVEKSAIQLMNFGKTKELKAGESTTIEITASMEFLASYDYTKAKTYILDAGDYYFAIGDNSHDALNNVIAKKSSANASLGDAKKVEKVTRGFDDTTYATSSITGNQITNLFDRADYNYFKPGSYQYLTRQDWTTFPTTEDYLSANAEMMKELSGQADLWDNHDYSNGDYDDEEEITTEAKNDHDLTEVYQNTDEKDSLWDLILDKMTIEEMCTFTQGNSLTRPIESIGYEGSVDGDGPAGFSGTFGDTETDNTEKLSARVYQSQCMLASTWNQDLAYNEGSFMGEDGLYLGKTSIWAPGANLHRTPYSARNFEYYSEDSMMAYYMGAQQCKGLQDKGCIACPKHFAFNDQEKNRCSLITFINEQEARELQLRCFEGSFTVGGAMGTMTSFTRIGLTYAGESHALMTDILRGEWGFKGYTITDYAAWNFMHAVECVKAGTDLFDTTGTTYSAVILAEMEKGEDNVLAAALRTANRRVLYAYVNSHAVEGYSIKLTPWWQTAIYAVDAALGSFTVVCGGVYISLALRAKRKED